MSLAVQASSLELATNCLALINAIAESSLQGNAISLATRTFFKWLANEKIDEEHYNKWAQKTAGLITVNESGLAMITELKKLTPKKTVAGIPVSFTGSVGRAMAYKADHQYLVTTVAVIMSFHDIPFAVKVLSNMAFDQGGHTRGVAYRYDVSKAFAARTMEKVVHSIALNVVNSGYATKGLPPSLKQFYNQNVVDKDTFAAVAMTVQPRETDEKCNKTDLLLDCDVLYGDITCWILSHFHGIFQVSVSGKVVYNQPLGTEPRKITMVIRYSPATEADAPKDTRDSYIRISTSLDGVLHVLLHEEPNDLKGSNPSKRLALYSVDHVLKRLEPSGIYLPSTPLLTLNQKELFNITLTTQYTAQWLLKLSLRPESGFCDLSFVPVLSGPTEGIVKLGELFQQWPAISRLHGFHLNAMQEDKTIVFKPPPEVGAPTLSSVLGRDGKHPVFEDQIPRRNNTDNEEVNDAELIVKCFQKVQDVLDVIQQRCDCPSCTVKSPIGSGKPGCLSETAMMVNSTLLAHTIAEGFGAPDVSGLVDNQEVRHDVQRLLRGVVKDAIVSWNTWFALATSVFLGCSSPNRYMDASEGAGELLAVQYGSKVVAANWADISARLRLDGIFGFDVAAGHMTGLTSEDAIVQAERTMERPNSPDNSMLEGEGWVFDDDDDEDFTGREILSYGPDVDVSDIVPGFFVFNAAGQKSHRLITILQTEKYHRYIDPAHGVSSLSRSCYLKCQHEPRTTSRYGLSHPNKGTVVLWTLEDLLGCWGASNDPLERGTNSHETKETRAAASGYFSTTATTYVTTPLDSELKVNVAMALSPWGCIIRDPAACCLNCALERSKTDLEGNPTYHARRIVNRVVDSRNTQLVRNTARSRGQRDG